MSQYVEKQLLKPLEILLSDDRYFGTNRLLTNMLNMPYPQKRTRSLRPFSCTASKRGVRGVPRPVPQLRRLQKKGRSPKENGQNSSCSRQRRLYFLFYRRKPLAIYIYSISQSNIHIKVQHIKTFTIFNQYKAEYSTRSTLFYSKWGKVQSAAQQTAGLGTATQYRV